MISAHRRTILCRVAVLFICTASARGADVSISTVSVTAKERINAQIPANASPVATDASLGASAITPGYTIIPLPAFVYNRNEGAWIGALTPIFRANAKGQIEDIYAPLYLRNKLIGDTFTFNYFGYRSGTRQFHFIASHATKVERLLDFGYKDIALGDEGRYIVSFLANSGKSAFNRFYGFGSQANEQRESNYAMNDSNVNLSAGINLSPRVAVLAGERFRNVRIENGVVSSLPQTLEAFPRAPGLGGAQIWAQGLTVAYDSRDNPLTPLRGTYASATTENEQNYQPGRRLNWWHMAAEVRNFTPNLNGRAVFVTHAFVDALARDRAGLTPRGVPFYERPTLGGENTLRAYGLGRFVSNHAVLLNLEERFSVVQRSIMGNVIELEVAPFLDIGRVGKNFDFPDFFDNMQYNPGLGLRVLARPNIAARLDVAYGRDGASVFVGLDYPF